MSEEDADTNKVETTLPRSRTRTRSASRSRPQPGRSILEVLNCKKDIDGDSPMVTELETFASIASRPPSPKPTRHTDMEAAISAAKEELTAAISKHSADFKALVTSSKVKRTPGRENRIRADNVALMVAASIRVQQAGGTRMALERLYEIARQGERAVLQLLEKAPTNNQAAHGGPTPPMSSITDAEGFSSVTRRSKSPPLTGSIAQAQGGTVRVNLFTEDFQKAGEDDLTGYALDPSSRQPTKKAFRGDESSLVTAAISTTSAASPARVSMYTKKRAALSSPATFGTGRTAPLMSLPSEVRTQEAARPLDESKLSRECRARRKEKKASSELEGGKKGQERLAKEAAGLVRIKGKGAATSDEDDDDTSDDGGLDPGGIYNRHSDEDDGSFSYHESEASTDDDDEEDLGEGASGYSPLDMRRFEPEEALVTDTFKWIKEVESRGTVELTDLLAEPVNRIFPCVACIDQKNILDRSTWLPAFLRKSSASTWDVLNVDFDPVVHDLQWEGDEGLENMWGLYYKFPDTQFVQSFKPPSSTKVGMVLAAHPIQDDDTTAATTFSSLMTSLTPGTSTTTSSTDALIGYNQEFQNALVKHRNDILCLIRKSATHGKPAIPTKMIDKIRAANLATMTLINKEVTRHGGKELSLRKMKELGAQAEKEATASFAAETEKIHTLENEVLHLPPAPPSAQWIPSLPPGFRVAQMELDGNCFYRSVSDQLFRDHGHGHVIVRHQINNHIRRNGDEFKHFLLLNDSSLELTDLGKYIEQMGQVGAWAGHPEIYAAAMCYKVDITIYSKDYAEIGGSLVFTCAGASDDDLQEPTMIYISYHDNNHFNSVRPPISTQPKGSSFLTGTERLEADMERAIVDHQDEVGQAIATDTPNNPSILEEKIKPIRENSRKIMSYIAHQLSSADGRHVSEAQLKENRDQAEERALGTVQEKAEKAPPRPDDPTLVSARSPSQCMVDKYEADLRDIISSYRDGIASILREIPHTKRNSTILATRYDELRSNKLPIMNALASLILHLGGKEITHDALSILADRAEEEALLRHNSEVAPMTVPPTSTLENPAMFGKEMVSPTASDDASLIPPPTRPKASLKPSKFYPVFAEQTPPRQADARMEDGDDDGSEPGVYSTLDEGVGDGTHFITASFVKTSEKIKDQLLTQVRYFMDLMCANIDGVKFHPVSTERSLPILKSSADKDYPTTGTKIRDYFHVQNEYSLIPGTRNKPKVPPQKVDADGRFQFDENRVYDGPDRITGIMLISAPCNVKQSISNLLIELEGDVHQIRYKPTQRKNSKAEKMFPGVPAVLCPQGLMRSIRHGLKKCEKALCSAKKFSIEANMTRYDLPLPIMTGYFKQVTPPKAPSDSESKEHSLNKIPEFKKNGCRMFVIEYDPIDNRRMSPVWALFRDSGEMERILGIRAKLQVIPPPGERDPNSITKNRRYCKHQVIYSSKVRYVQHKSVINLDHEVTLAMTDRSAPPRSVTTLRQEYFDLETEDGGKIIHGVFVRMESQVRGPSVEATHMASNKEAKSILSKIAHCPSAWWYWHWVEKGYTQGAILSLLNSFEAEAADNAHDSTYDPQARTITSMFAGDDDNQWLDQVEEEFGSDLSDHDEDAGNGNGTNPTFMIEKDAKESLAKEMKEKDYDLEGVDSRSSKRTHRTNMTGRTGATSARSVTTKKYAMDFKQQKTDLNTERKKNALLEQRLREMEAALATGGISSTPKRSTPSLDGTPTAPTATKTITISTPAISQTRVLAEKTITKLCLPPPHSDNSTAAGSTTMSAVGRWD
jgi:hypothetical protein